MSDKVFGICMTVVWVLVAGLYLSAANACTFDEQDLVPALEYGEIKYLCTGAVLDAVIANVPENEWHTITEADLEHLLDVCMDNNVGVSNGYRTITGECCCIHQGDQLRTATPCPCPGWN